MADTLNFQAERSRRQTEKIRQAIAACDEMIDTVSRLESSETRNDLKAKHRTGGVRRVVVASSLVDPEGLSADELAKKVSERNAKLEHADTPKAAIQGIQGNVRG